MSETTGTTQGSTDAQGSTNTQAQENDQAQAVGNGTANAQANGGNVASDAAKEAMRKMRIKYQDGKEEEVDEEEVLKTYRDRRGHQAAANKILQEGKAAKKQAETFITMMKDKGKLFETLKKLGHDPRQLSEEYLTEQLKYEMMDERDRQLLEKERKLKEYETRDVQEKERREKEAMEMATNKYTKEYSDQIIEALKDSPIPQNKESVKMMARYIGQAAKYKIPMTAKEAAKLVEQDLKDVQSRIYKDASAEQLVKLLGEEGLQKIRAFETSRVKTPEQDLHTPKEQGEASRRNKGQRMTTQEWRAFNRPR